MHVLGLGEIWFEGVLRRSWENRPSFRLTGVNARPQSNSGKYCQYRQQRLRPGCTATGRRRLRRRLSMRGERDAVALVNELLTDAGMSMDSFMTKVLGDRIDVIERIDHLTAIAETRRNAALREIDRRRQHRPANHSWPRSRSEKRASPCAQPSHLFRSSLVRGGGSACA